MSYLKGIGLTSRRCATNAGHILLNLFIRIDEIDKLEHLHATWCTFMSVYVSAREQPHLPVVLLSSQCDIAHLTADRRLPLNIYPPPAESFFILGTRMK